MSTLTKVCSGLSAVGIPAELVTELTEAFAEAKKRFFASDLRPNSSEGGRFSEAAFRILQWQTQGTYIAIGKTLPHVDTMMSALANAPGSDSVRIHIPRT